MSRARGNVWRSLSRQGYGCLIIDCGDVDPVSMFDRLVPAGDVCGQRLNSGDICRGSAGGHLSRGRHQNNSSSF